MGPLTPKWSPSGPKTPPTKGQNDPSSPQCADFGPPPDRKMEPKRPQDPHPEPQWPSEPSFLEDFLALRAPLMAPSLRRSVNPWIHRCIGPGSIDASTHRSIDRSMSWGPSPPRPIDASFYRSVDPWIHRYIDPSIDPISVDTCIHRCIEASIDRSMHPTI